MYTRSERRHNGKYGFVFPLMLGLMIMAAFIIIPELMQRNSEALMRYSNSNHGNCLEEVAMQLLDEDCEVMALFTMDGRKLFEWTSSEHNHVETPAYWIEKANLCAFSGVTAMHNHPGTDSAFSSGDLLMASQTKCKRQIVVTPHSMYILEAPKGWPKYDEAYEFLQREIYDNFEAATALNYVFLSSHASDTGEFYTTPAFIERYAEEFDLVFRVEVLNR